LGTNASCTGDETTTHTCTLSGLTESTLYHYNVTCEDAAGNTATAGTYNFTTDATTVNTASVMNDMQTVIIVFVGFYALFIIGLVVGVILIAVKGDPDTAMKILLGGVVILVTTAILIGVAVVAFYNIGQIT
jgi:hypothetical protein